jgi:hypothetical protein
MGILTSSLFNQDVQSLLFGIKISPFDTSISRRDSNNLSRLGKQNKSLVEAKSIMDISLFDGSQIFIFLVKHLHNAAN